MLDAEVEGFRATEVLARMRADARHRTTPVVLAGELGERAKGMPDALGAPRHPELVAELGHPRPMHGMPVVRHGADAAEWLA